MDHGLVSQNQSGGLRATDIRLPVCPSGWVLCIKRFGSHQLIDPDAGTYQDDHEVSNASRKLTPTAELCLLGF